MIPTYNCFWTNLGKINQFLYALGDFWKMFSNNKELFDFISSLIKKLQEINEDNWSQAFKNAMAISFMPGEILVEIRLTLMNFKNTDLPKQLNLEQEINGAIKSLDQALNK